MTGDDREVREIGLGEAAPAPFARDGKEVVPFAPSRRSRVQPSEAKWALDPDDRPAIKVLLIDSSRDDAAIIRELLGRAETAEFVLHHAADADDGLSRLLRGDHDIALVEQQQAVGNGLELIRTTERLGVAQPLILLSGCATAGLDVAAIGAGAADFLDKEQLEVERLERTIRLALARRDHARLDAPPLRDGLTGLASRSAYLDQVARALARARRRGGVAAVLLVDVDRFGATNRRFGTAIGNSLLRLVAARLQRHLRETDTAARLAGARFGIVLDELARAEHAGTVAAKLLCAIASPVTLAEESVTVTASAGVAAFPDDGGDAAALVAAATAALGEAKRQGGAAVRRHADGPVNSHSTRAMAVALDRAIRSNELVLLFQPQVTLCSPDLGLASIVSWPRAPDGAIDGHAVAALADDAALTEPLAEWLVDAACRQAAAWRGESLGPLHVAVPLLSRRSLGWSDLPRRLERHLAAAGAPPDWLELELDEALLLEERTTRARTLHAIRHLGVRLAVGGYGSGVTSLATLRDLPLTTIKLGRTLLEGVPDDQRSRAVVHSVVALARELGLRIVADGVEGQSALHLLRQLGCDAVQSLSSCPPLPANACADWLRQAARRS